MDKDSKTAKQLDALNSALRAFDSACADLKPKMQAVADAGQDMLDASHLECARTMRRCGLISDASPLMSLLRRVDLVENQWAVAKERVAELEKREDDARLRECVARTDWTRAKADNAELKKENSELRRRLVEAERKVTGAEYRECAAQSELAHLKVANCDLRTRVRAFHTELAELAEAKVNQGKRDDPSPDLPKRVRDALRDNGFDAEFETSPWRDGVVVVFSGARVQR